MNRRTLVASTLAAIPASLPLAARAEPRFLADDEMVLRVMKIPMSGAGLNLDGLIIAPDAELMFWEVEYNDGRVVRLGGEGRLGDFLIQEVEYATSDRLARGWLKTVSGYTLYLKPSI